MEDSTRRLSRSCCVWCNGLASGLWHATQHATRLPRSSVPPTRLGVLWSTVLAHAPQYWHVCRSLVSTSALIRRHAAVLPLSVSADVEGRRPS